MSWDKGLYDSNVLVAYRRPRPEWLAQQSFVIQVLYRHLPENFSGEKNKRIAANEIFGASLECCFCDRVIWSVSKMPLVRINLYAFYLPAFSLTGDWGPRCPC